MSGDSWSIHVINERSRTSCSFAETLATRCKRRIVHASFMPSIGVDLLNLKLCDVGGGRLRSVVLDIGD